MHWFADQTEQRVADHLALSEDAIERVLVDAGQEINGLWTATPAPDIALVLPLSGPSFCDRIPDTVRSARGTGPSQQRLGAASMVIYRFCPCDGGAASCHALGFASHAWCHLPPGAGSAWGWCPWQGSQIPSLPKPDEGVLPLGPARGLQGGVCGRGRRERQQPY